MLTRKKWGDEMKRLLVIGEVAEILRCSKKTVYRLISEGELEALHVRGSLRLTKSSVERYIKTQIEKFQRQNGRCKNGSSPGPDGCRVKEEPGKAALSNP